jgi:hypothetical protein
MTIAQRFYERQLKNAVLPGTFHAILHAFGSRFSVVFAMTSGQPILQSGSVTPGHLWSVTTDGVAQDSGVSFNNTQAIFQSTITNVNFNSANTDNQVLINLPVGFTRWRMQNIYLSGASGTLTTATCGLFTQPAAGGVAIVTSGSAINVNTSSIDTNNNGQVFTINNQNTLFYSDTAIYFRVQNPQGNAATGNITVDYVVLP